MSNDKKQGGLKFDGGKPPLELIPYDAEEEIANVLAYGLKKYGGDTGEVANWAKGIEYSRLIGAANRHIKQFNKGIDKDHESGLSHIAHAAANLIFLLWMEKNRPDMDNRWEKFLVKPPRPIVESEVLESSKIISMSKSRD